MEWYYWLVVAWGIAIPFAYQFGWWMDRRLRQPEEEPDPFASSVTFPEDAERQAQRQQRRERQQREAAHVMTWDEGPDERPRPKFFSEWQL